MDDCLFCKIIKKEIPSTFLYESDIAVVFRDINPQAPTHLLIVPKKHIRSINNLQDNEREILAELFFIAKEMAKKEGVDKSGYKLFFHIEKGGGQVIFHLHLHLVGGWKNK